MFIDKPRIDMTTEAPEKDATAAQDWHRADIIAGVRKAGWTLASLSRHHGYSKPTLRITLDRKWPKGQQLIADAIGVAPQTIWPSRYEQKHKTNIVKTVVRAYRKNKQALDSSAAKDTRKAA